MAEVFEYRWAYWDDNAQRFAQSAVWMTDEEARCDFFAYDDPRSYRIEHTKRDRNRTATPPVMPPADDVDWTKERRKRAEKSRYGLPPFVTPTYRELRRVWAEHRNEDVRRLALEVQTARHALAELEALAAEEYWHASKDSCTVDDARKAIARIRRRLMQEINRIGPLTGERSNKAD